MHLRIENRAHSNGAKMAKALQFVDPKDLIIVGLDTDATEEAVLYDERIKLEVSEDLIKNIAYYGVKSPILVRQDGTKWVVVDGRQRTRAARIANLRAAERGEMVQKVPVLPCVGNDATITGIMVSTNEQRVDDDVLVKALKAARMLEFGSDKSEICVAFGRTPQTINAWLRLAQAHPSVHAAIRSGQVSTSAGIELAALERDEQVAKLNVLTAEIVAVEESGASKSQVTTKSARETKGDRKVQPGVKRSWVAKALKSKAFKSLKPSQREVLSWFATGVAGKDSWMQAFVNSVTVEWGVDELEADAAAEVEAASEVAVEATSEAAVEAAPATPPAAEVKEPIVETVVESNGDKVTVTILEAPAQAAPVVVAPAADDEGVQF